MLLHVVIWDYLSLESISISTYYRNCYQGPSANIIHRCFTSHNIGLLVRAYIVYVRSLVEHDSVIWSPLLKQDIEKVERVQRCFTKRLPGFSDLSYEDRLRRLDLPSLELRRLHNDLIWCYNILLG